MTRRPRFTQPERLRVDEAACILGIEHRTVQALAKRGDLPGAAKVGRVWTFNEATLREWISKRATAWQNEKPPQNGAIGEAMFSGSGSLLTVAKSEKACEQALSKLRENARKKLERVP